MTNDDLANQLAGLAMQALIINGNADPAGAQDVMQKAYAFALAGVTVKNSIGAVPEQITPATAVLPPLDTPPEPAPIQPVTP